LVFRQAWRRRQASRCGDKGDGEKTLQKCRQDRSQIHRRRDGKSAPRACRGLRILAALTQLCGSSLLVFPADRRM
jgi:hypothetical protein